MKTNLAKLMSIGVVAVMVGYCSWSYIFARDKALAAQHAENLPAIAASLLAPAIEPVGSRDPFRPVPTPPLAAAELAPTHEEIESGAESGAESVPEDESESDTDVSPTAFALAATFVRGDQRVALINGRIYAQGELLADSGTATTPLVVSQIFADKVFIERKGQLTELGFPDPSAASPSSTPANPKKPATTPARVPTKVHSKPHGGLSPSTKRAPNTRPTKVRNDHE